MTTLILSCTIDVKENRHIIVKRHPGGLLACRYGSNSAYDIRTINCRLNH